MDTKAMVALQGQLADFLSFATNPDQLLNNALNWIWDVVGPMRAVVWQPNLNRRRREFVSCHQIYPAAQEHTRSEVLDAIIECLTRFQLAESHFESFCCYRHLDALSLSEIPDLKGNVMVAARCTYEGDTKLVIAMFRQTPVFRTAFTQDHLDALRVVSVVLPEIYDGLLRETQFKEGERVGTWEESEDDDWWLKGGKPPF